MRNIQATGTLYGNRMTVKQISKARARRLFSEGIEVYLQSCNMYPFNSWQSICPIKVDTERVKSEKEYFELCQKNGYKLPVHEPTAAGQFDMICNNYSYYNTDSERGKYISFYEDITPAHIKAARLEILENS